MCRRALHKKMKISLNPEYHQRKAAKMRQLQMYDITRRPVIPTSAPPPPPPPKPKQINNQFVVETNVLLSFD